MYHRYSPEQDGSFRRRSIPDAPQNPKPHNPPSAAPPEKPPFSRLPVVERLLPLCCDDGDTLLLLILLLLLSDGNEDSQSVALTLAIFLFLQ